MDNCCKTIGSFSSQTPKGIESTIAEHKVYITSPDHSQNDIVVVVIPDVFVSLIAEEGDSVLNDVSLPL